jgi:hypothetical protein
MCTEHCGGPHMISTQWYHALSSYRDSEHRTVYIKISLISGYNSHGGRSFGSPSYPGWISNIVN